MTRWTALFLAFLIATAATPAVAQVVILEGATVDAALDPLMLLPDGGVLTSIELLVGFWSLGYEPRDLLTADLGLDAFFKWNEIAPLPLADLGRLAADQLHIYDATRGIFEEGTAALASSSLTALLARRGTLAVLSSRGGSVGSWTLGGSFLLADTDPPILIVPPDIDRATTAAAGTTVTYAVSVADNLDPNPAVGCAPASGSLFSLGATTVRCTASDFSGNSATADFEVVVTRSELPGDVNGDGVVDRRDLDLVLAARGEPAHGPDDPRDLDGDGVITVLDGRKLILLCSQPRCATP